MTSLFETKELTPAQIKIILDSVPLLEALGEKLIKKFYAKFLKETRVYFNSTHMELKRQPKALMFAVLQYAKNIQDLTPLLGFVKKVVTKHAGLQVPPDLYPLAGACLVGAFAEVFPHAVINDDFVEAWTIAYGNLANLLISLEQAEYESAAWPGFKEFVVTKIEDECEDVKSVYFTPADGSEIVIPERGQYLSFRWNIPEEVSREYSISKFPKDNEYRISLRHIPGGKVSGYVHKKLQVGDTLRVGVPRGLFTYEPTKKDIVFLAGGIGITALLAMIEASLENGNKVLLMYSNRTSNSRPFTSLLRQYKFVYGDQFQIIEYFSRPSRFYDPIQKYYRRSLVLDDLDMITPEQDVYAIGPRTYMKMIDDHLRGKNINIKLDYFGPPEL